MKNFPCHPSGRARTQVLIVAVLLLLLIGVAVPALVKLRISAADIRCEDQLRKIGIACHDYAVIHGGFPPSRITKNNDAAAYVPPNTGRGSVLITLLPHLGQEAVYDRYRRDRDWCDPANTGSGVLTTVLDNYRCPLAPGPRFETVQADGKTKYLVGFTFPYVEEQTREPFTGFVADYATLVQVRVEKRKTAVGLGLVAGYSVDHPPGFGAMRQNVVTPLNSIQDGLSQTSLFSELSGRPSEYFKGPVEKANSYIDDSIWASHDFRIYVNGTDVTGRVKGGPCVINCNNRRDIFSFHPGGANILFADGRVKFVRDTLTAETLTYLVTANGGESIPSLE
jgi:prepilin-type processing-associated H-X9-DG protein